MYFDRFLVVLLRHQAMGERCYGGVAPQANTAEMKLPHHWPPFTGWATASKRIRIASDRGSQTDRAAARCVTRGIRGSACRTRGHRG